MSLSCLATYVNENGDPTAGLRLEIPSHLLMVHKLLIMYGYNLRNRHGKETRRIIKFNLIEQSLYLSYKLPGSELWHDITPAMAKTFKEQENQRSLLSFSDSLSPPERRSILTEANATLISGTASTGPMLSLQREGGPSQWRREDSMTGNQTWKPQRTSSSR